MLTDIEKKLRAMGLPLASEVQESAEDDDHSNFVAEDLDTSPLNDD